MTLRQVRTKEAEANQYWDLRSTTGLWLPFNSPLMDRLVTSFGADADWYSSLALLSEVLAANGNRIDDPRLVARLRAAKLRKEESQPQEGDGSGSGQAEENENSGAGTAAPQSDEPSQGEPSESASGHQSGEETNDTAFAGSDVEPQDADGEDCAEGHADAAEESSKGQPDGAAANEEADTPESSQEVGLLGELCLPSEEKPGAALAQPDTQGDAQSPRRGRLANVMFADEQKAKKEAKTLTAKGRLAARLLTRAVRKYTGGAGVSAPRWNGEKIVRELVSRRYSLPKMRGRDSQKRRPCLVMVDVSGSCSATCQDTLTAALAAQAMMPAELVVLWHTNGDYEAHVGKAYTRTDGQYWLDEWGMVVNFGDADAANQLEAVARAGSRLIWLDSYNKRAGFAPASGKTARELRTWGDVTKFNGCGGVDDFIRAMRGIF